MKTVENINRNLCTGCGACENVCPVSAITMVENGEGFRFPEIDHDRCAGCGKCFKICPAENGIKNIDEYKPVLYGVTADETAKTNGTSVGIFPVLADYVLSKGGYVAGAVWDENFDVKHVITNDKTVVESMSGPKYVQSRIGDSYKKIKKLLRDNIYVLFGGTPCQVAGLKAYLQEDYETLICFDVMCQGIPSHKSLETFLKSVAMPTNPDIPADDYDNYSKYIKDIQFRNSTYYGSNNCFIVDFTNGMSYSKSRNETVWYNAYIDSNIINRLSCGNCTFNTSVHISDISVGDFRSANKSDSNNIVFVNTKKGKKIFEDIKNKFAFVNKFSAVDGKSTGIVSASKPHSQRSRFFKLLNSTGDFKKSYDFATKQKYDIGFIGWWYGINYGSVLTNYALNRYLVQKGYSVLMLNYPVSSYSSLPKTPEDTISQRFAAKHYTDIGKHRTYGELYQLNSQCDTFVVASDQLWNYWSTKSNGLYFFLNFAGDYKKKISYSTSFGHSSYVAPPEITRQAAYHMSRFDSVSVRETDAVDICRDTFGVDAVQNMDPVFICSKNEYDKLIEESTRTEKDYILAYILTPTNEKAELLRRLEKQTGKKVYLILDAVKKKYNESKKIMNMDGSLVGDIEVVDWLYFMKNADFVITDSFHAICFSIIFKKNFACIGNLKRGLSRFMTILDAAGLKDRMVFDPMDIIDLYSKEIDFNAVDSRLEPEIHRSQEWLDTALGSNKPYKASTYDVLLQRITELEAEVKELKNNSKK